MKHQEKPFATAEVVSGMDTPRPLLAAFLHSDLRPDWTAEDAAEDFADYIGVRNGQGVRAIVDEVKSLPADRRTSLAALAALSGHEELTCSPTVGMKLIAHMRVIVDALTESLD